MKTPFLPVFLLAHLLLTSGSAKHLLLETVDKTNDSVAATPTPVAAGNSNKAGSDYMGCGPLWFLGCTKSAEVLEIPLDDDGTDFSNVKSKDPFCRGNSRHGAPCTT